MTGHRQDQLDIAIDRVAAGLVNVEPDGLMADRIVAQLPERSATWSWMLKLAPQFAAATGVALLAYFLVWNRSTDVVDKTATFEAAASPSASASASEASAAPSVPARKTSGGLRRDRAIAASGREAGPADDTFDREFGLKPVAGPSEIAVSGVEAPAMIDVSSVELAPIVLTDLPLASESPSPR